MFTRAVVRTLGVLSGQVRTAISRFWRLEAALRGVTFSGPTLFLGRPVITLAPGSRIALSGDNEFFSSARCNAVGNARPCFLRTLAPGARLEIGRGVGMSSTTVCATVSVTIGEGTICGAGVMILDSDLHVPAGAFGWRDAGPLEARPIQIGRGCFLGAGAVVLKGVTIGDRAVVGAGAVVTRDVPAGMIAVGNPARNVPGKILPASDGAHSTAATTGIR